MFQDMSKAFGQSMGPFKDLVDIQTKMLETLTRQQMECTKSCIDATLAQTQEMQKCQSPADLLTLQKAYAKQLEETLTGASQKNLQALEEARSAMERLAQDAYNAFAPK